MMHVAGGSVNFFMHTDAVVTNVALIPNLRLDAALVQCTGGEPSLALLYSANLTCVDIALVGELLMRRRR